MVGQSTVWDRVLYACFSFCLCLTTDPRLWLTGCDTFGSRAPVFAATPLVARAGRLSRLTAERRSLRACETLAYGEMLDTSDCTARRAAAHASRSHSTNYPMHTVTAHHAARNKKQTSCNIMHTPGAAAQRSEQLGPCSVATLRRCIHPDAAACGGSGSASPNHARAGSQHTPPP